MGEVISYTKGGIDQLLDEVVVGGSIVGTNLSLTRGDASVITIPLPAGEGIGSIMNYVDHADVASNVDLLWGDGNGMQRMRLTGATVTIDLPSDVPANEVHRLLLEIVQDATGGRTITLTAVSSVVDLLGGGLTINPTPNSRTFIELVTHDAGTSWLLFDNSYITSVKTSTMGVVIHGTDANVIRPIGYPVVHWVGTAMPANALENDLWTNA